MKRILYILLVIIVVFCMSLQDKPDARIGYIEILQIKKEKLLPILDNIISHEQRCVYYTPELYFSIHSQVTNDTITEFHIEAFVPILIESDDRFYKGCFKHNGHWFFVKTQVLDESIFIKTNQRKAFSFYKASEIASDGKIILRIIEDDTFSFWIYHYVDNEFFLMEMNDAYCKE